MSPGSVVVCWILVRVLPGALCSQLYLQRQPAVQVSWTPTKLCHATGAKHLGAAAPCMRNHLKCSACLNCKPSLAMQHADHFNGWRRCWTGMPECC